jgi:hypothetical protein
MRPISPQQEQALTRRHFLLAVVGGVAATGVLAVWLGLGVGGAGVTLWVADLATPLAALVACVLCFRARARHRGRMRQFWLLLGCAAASWAFAEVIWAYYELILGVESPVPSWADLGYLSAIPLAVAALVTHPATTGSRTHKARWLFDGMVIATALLFLSWTLILAPLWRSADLSTWTGVVTLAYPFGDVVIVFFIVLAIRGMTGGNRLTLWCLLTALLAMALTDSTFTYLSEVANYRGGDVIDSGWIAAYLGIALAAFSSRFETAAVPTAESSRPSLAALTYPLLVVLIALSVAAVEIRLGHHLDHAALAMALGLIALVLTRQGLMVFELLASGRDAKDGFMQRLTHVALGRSDAGESQSSRLQVGGQ